MKLYGSLSNRLDENGYYNGTYNNIQVGTLCTEYLWSDRHAYEVVEVKDQKHIKIRRLKAIRTDNYGMSDLQHYDYERDETNPIKELQLFKSGWKEIRYSAWKDNKRLGSVKINISFGIADEYYDYSF